MRMERQTLILRRRMPAARASVYAAWTDPARFALWWGPEDVVNDCTLDVRVGGAWRDTMRMPDGESLVLSGLYREVEPDARLVFTMDTSAHPDAWHALLDSFRDTPSGARGGDVVATVTFADGAADETVMTVSQFFELPSDRDAYYKMGAPTGWAQSFDRLERELGAER